MRNIVISLAFDGRKYHGWQRQNNAVTVQETLEATVGIIMGEYCLVHGCSRTDAGVHANCFVASFKTNCSIPVSRIPIALNSRLPCDITVFSAKEENENFHARFSCVGKEYVYKILNTPYRDPFLQGLCLHYPHTFDIKRAEEGARYLVGEHDFAAFMAQGSPVSSTVRKINYLKIDKQNDLITLRIHGNGFLYNMVRIITGTLLYVSEGKIEPYTVSEIIDSKERAKAGPTVIPCGLYLNRVDY